MEIVGVTGVTVFEMMRTEKRVNVIGETNNVHSCYKAHGNTVGYVQTRPGAAVLDSGVGSVC